MEKCLTITVDKSDSLVSDLQKFGYEKRSGSVAYKRDLLVIVPKKKWYWETANETKGTKFLQL